MTKFAGITVGPLLTEHDGNIGIGRFTKESVKPNIFFNALKEETKWLSLLKYEKYNYSVYTGTYNDGCLCH